MLKRAAAAVVLTSLSWMGASSLERIPYARAWAADTIAEEKNAGWSREVDGLAERVAQTGRLVIHVYVPLCDNAQINCGSTKAGEPENLDHNLYWGAIFGNRRFFQRKASAFEQVGVFTPDKPAPLLQRAVFKQRLSGKLWGSDKEIVLWVVLDAYRGGDIDAAVDDFYKEADGGSTISFGDGEAATSLQVDVVGYAGHNRMMDGKLPPARTTTNQPIPSFVMACRSDQYFSKPLADLGSRTLIMTRDYMAPEGYVIEAIVTALGENRSRADVRGRTVRAYAKWQKIEENVASTIFAK